MLIPVCFLASVLHQCLCMDLTYSIKEGKSPGTYIGDVATDSHVVDSVLPQNRTQIRFTQLEQGEDDSSHFFRIGRKSGKLFTAQTLDAEALCKHNVECFKMVKVAVRRAKTFTKILKVKVIIVDINDHQPEFPEKRVEIQFSERDGKGTKISIPNAVDRDVGALNSQIEYFLNNNTSNHFTLSVTKSVDGTSELSLILEKRLNREIQDLYTIQVIARDGGMPPKQSILDVHITVTDVNDNLPVFSQSVFNISISNDHDVSIPVIVLTANDLDSGKNGRITYLFSVKTSNVAKTLFEINQVTGEITLQKKLPPGHKMTYKLYVKAMDGGRPPLSSMTMVLVNVINQQNNAPFMDVNFISTSLGNIAAISEDFEVDSFIAYVMVTDHDIGRNGDVSCVLRHEKFDLQSLGTKEYKITIKERLDREKEDHYEITITCQDKGIPPLYSRSDFSIQVMDVNDVRPEFSQETFKFSIDENRPSKYPVGYVNVTDPDLGPGGILTFMLLTNNKHFLPFQITDDGLISTLMSLDYEFQTFYEFQVFVKDNGVPSLNNTANITIEVRDKNDNAPYFTFPSVDFFTLDVLYYPHHTNITMLQASDSDSQENAFLKYEILQGNEKQLFSVHPYTGLLSFKRVVTQQDAGSYDLEFGIRDSGIPSLSATTSLYLTLTVRNSTSQIQNSAHTGTEDKIHLYLLVIIVLVAVTISVTITACVSICILRCKERRNSTLGIRVSAHCKCIAGGGRYKCPTHQTACWPSDPIAVSTNKDKDSTRNTLPKPKKVSYSRSDQHVKHKASDVIYQEIGGNRKGTGKGGGRVAQGKGGGGGGGAREDEIEQRQFMIPKRLGGIEDDDDDDGWSETEGLSDLYTCRRYKPLSSLTDQVQDVRAKPRRQAFFSSGDTRTISRALYQSNIGHIPDCSKWIDLKAATTGEDNSGGIIGQQSSSSSLQTEGLNFTLDSLKQQHQLQLQQQAARKYSDYLGQVSQSENCTQESIKKISHSRNRHRKTSVHSGYKKKH